MVQGKHNSSVLADKYIDTTYRINHSKISIPEYDMTFVRGLTNSLKLTN